MPSSLVFAALVIAWLAVLVPVVARRRQMVPRPAEADLSARVLTRPDRSVAVGVDEEVVMTSTTDQVAPEAELEEPRGRVLDRARPRPEPEDDHDDVDDLHEDAYDEDDHEDERDRRPRAYRPGRGGFDADAAAAAAHARYAFRQRVAIGLIAVAVLAALAALVVSSTLWWLVALTVVGLAGYLVFLRQQTRIEDEVRQRRLARLTGERRALEARRERQAEHEARLADAEEWGHYESGEYEIPAARDGHDEYEDVEEFEEPRWVAPRTPAPAVPAGMELVADTEDDPAFCDLDDHRVPAYRRGA
ncbi:gephyrin-like molybdotransferase receptor GlpR [Actinomycetospora atypica]|uniref:Gephyrin-like molybdotransferase receptor GlpR n=1 Tax=Actinomycetospora atypica TaxID=1290095 RepID=A0ABV9YPQ5_9PSEU